MKTLALSAFWTAALALTAVPALAQSPAPSPAPVTAQAPASARIALTFDVGAATGMIMVALYDSETAYPDGRPVRTARVDVAAGNRVAVFDGLPAGAYAMKAFHDLDGDGTLDFNPFGIPTEPYAFSNNAVGNMGPASWDRAHFAASGETAQTIRMR